jgi:two-component system response regulator RegA
MLLLWPVACGLWPLPRLGLSPDNHAPSGFHPTAHAMKDRPTILFVDDEPPIRTTLPAILNRFGFDVTAAGTVPEALHLIATRQFDVLISDLNIGQPGDGFTVVSAMRRTQPDAVTLILTGYPAFETALEAIRQQVDDYLVKPAEVGTLVENIREKLTTPPPRVHRIEARRLADILARNTQDIVQRWLRAAREDPEINAVRLTDQELADHVPRVIAEIVTPSMPNQLSGEAAKDAAIHGKTRFKQGCTMPSIVREARILQNVISRFVQENLLALEISSVIPDVMYIGETIQAFLEESIRAYVHARHAAADTVTKGKPRTVLLLNRNPEVSRLRAYALERAGFAVTRADSRQEALRLLDKKFDALVVSYSLSTESIGEMTELFRQRNPGAAIVTIAKEKWRDMKIDVDFTVTGDEGPEAMIEGVLSALNRRRLLRVK